MVRLFLTLSVLLLAQPAFAATRSCDPAQFGARADGKTKDTKAIQAAIDDCAAKGGGTVTFTKGTYVSAPIILKSNVTLDVAAGATLLGSPDHADYPQTTVFQAPGRQALITAVNAHDISITGKGTIDGNGAK
ncbi:MAG TPA: glycosyl hydrolase family 28-related protein, partial [Rhizomicrobium sp.]|nr:glycosyl hydrolase family 28-related protein [Rhizomicrobium sp.]